MLASGGRDTSIARWRPPYGGRVVEILGGPKPRVRKFERKTISVIPTGANGNIGNTGPGLWLASGVSL